MSFTNAGMYGNQTKKQAFPIDPPGFSRYTGNICRLPLAGVLSERNSDHA